MDVTWGVTYFFVPTRGTDMESENKQEIGDKENTMTARYGKGNEQEGREKEGEPLNPFAKAPRVIRTPPKGPRPRVDSCPELKLPLVKIRGVEEKRKRTEADSLSPPMMKETIADRESRTDDEVFVVEGSPSPETSRRPKKMRELGPFSTKIACVQIGEIEEESMMSNGLIQLMQKLENMAGDLSYQTKKNVNTKVEIKKLAREIDTMSQMLARKLHKYCKTVARKLRRSSDKETSPVAAPAQVEAVHTKDTASQTEPSTRKLRRKEDVEKVTDAATDEDIIAAAKQKWKEEWFIATTVRVGNPWNSLGGEDFAILVTEHEDGMDSGIGRLLKDRFPEIGKIEVTGTMKTSITSQVGAEDPVIRNRQIHKVRFCGTSDAEILAALKELGRLASEGCKSVAVPVPTGTDEGKFRILTELVFRKLSTRIIIHTPQGKGGKGKTPQSRMSNMGEINRPKRDKNTEVLLIKQGGKTYGEMVKGLRTMVGNQEVKALKQIRKTQDGRLLLALKKGEAAVEDIKKQIEDTWEAVEVSGGDRSGSGQKHTVHVKGLDVAVEDDDIRAAIREMAPTLQNEDIEIGPRRPMFGGNMAVTVRVSGRDVEQLSNMKKMKIGFNMCSIEERLNVTKCYRCWEFGHIAKNCRGPDRRLPCSGCGQEGHLAAACQNPPHCLLCDKDGHRGGSGVCPKFKEALFAKRASRETQSSQTG